MSNPLYQQLNHPQPQNQFNQFMQNPAFFLSQRGLNIPQNIQNNPKAIIQNMLNTGAVSQDRFNSALQLLKQNGYSFN